MTIPDNQPPVHRYEEALDLLPQNPKARHLLLGNGFSIACDPVFHYGSLFEAAKDEGLSDRAQLVFERLGTNNFEGAMRLLDDSHWVANQYELVEKERSGMLDDAQIIKNTLLKAVSSSHLEHTGLVPDYKKDAALDFIDGFQNVFTTNYDLLLYWVIMHAGPGPTFMDGFDSDPDDPEAPYVVFQHRSGGSKGIHFLHGGLHLYLEGGELRKHTWCRTGQCLTDSVKQGLEQNQYPLFVAEGTPEQKLSQIQRTGYLWYCLEKLKSIQGPLVVLGQALGPSDQHLADAIANNGKLQAVAVGLYGSLNSESNQAIVQATQAMYEARERARLRHHRYKELEFIFFDSETAAPWGG